MKRKEIDEAILNAITILKHQNKPVTAANIVEVPETKLRLHHIYTSKHIDKIEVRGRNQRLENMRNTRALFSTENSSVDAETDQAAKDRLREKSLGARHLIVEKPSADNKINRVSISLNYTIGVPE
jgi:hypothetical protein